MTAIASRLNAWLTPTVRKYLHAGVSLLAAVLGIWGMSTATVNVWVALLLAIGGLGSAILSAIVTKRPDMAALYAAAAAADAALVALRFLRPEIASQIDATLAVLVTFFSGYSFTRTDTTTETGAPAAETAVIETPTAAATVSILPAVPDVAYHADGTPVTTSNASTLAIDGRAVYNPGNGDEPTTSTL